MTYINLTKNYKQKIEDSIGSETIVSKAIETVKKTVDKLSTKQKLGALAGVALAATIGIQQFPKSPEISIESTTTQIQAEINKIVKERDKETDESKQKKLQNRIDELVKIKEERTYIVVACGSDKKDCLPDMLRAYRSVQQVSVQSLLKAEKSNPDEFNKRKFYKKVIIDGKEQSVYLSEAHIKLINKVLKLIEDKKIVFDSGERSVYVKQPGKGTTQYSNVDNAKMYPNPGDEEFAKYGVYTEAERTVKDINEGRIGIAILTMLEAVGDRFERIQVNSMYRDPIKTNEYPISIHSLYGALDIGAIGIKNNEGKIIMHTAQSASDGNPVSIYYFGLISNIIKKTEASYQELTWHPQKKNLLKKEGFVDGLKDNDPKSGRVSVFQVENHDNHSHYTPTIGGFTTLPYTREKFEALRTFNRQKNKPSPNFNKRVRDIVALNSPSIHEDPSKVPTSLESNEETVKTQESTRSSYKIDRTTKGFKRYMENGSDLSTPGFIEAVEAIAKKYNANPNVILATLAKESNIS
jgi:hypothetical protein